MEQPYNLLGVIQSVWRWRKRILQVCGVVALLSVVGSLLLSNYYKSTAIFYAASSTVAIPEPVGNETKVIEYYGGEDAMDRMLTIAESTELAQYLIQKYDLATQYDINVETEKGPSKVLKRFRKLFSVKKTKYAAIEISYEDHDRNLPKRLMDDAIQKIDNMGQELIKAGQRKEFESRNSTIAVKEASLKTLSDSLISLRKKYKIYNALSQSEVYTSQLSSAEKKKSSAEAKVEVYSKFRKYQDSVFAARADLGAAEKEILLFQGKLEQLNDGMSAVESLNKVRAEAVEQLSLNMERLKQLESSIQGDFNSIYIVEQPLRPLEKSRPMRSIIVVLSVFGAALFSIIGVLLLEAYRSVNWKEGLND